MTTPPRELTSLEVDKLRSRLEPLIDRVAAETGLAISIGKVTFSTNNAVFAIEAAVRGHGGVTMGREAEAFLMNAMQFGLEPGDLGCDFQHLDNWYRIIGMRPRSKTPVICQRIEPPRSWILFPAHLVRHYLEKHGFRTKVSPHARVKIEIGGEPDGEPPAVTS